MGLFTWLGLASGDAGSFAEGLLLDHALEKPVPSMDHDRAPRKATIERRGLVPATPLIATPSTGSNVPTRTRKVHYRKSMHGGFDTM